MKGIVIVLILVTLMSTCADIHSMRCDYATVHGIESHFNPLNNCLKGH